MWGRWIGCVCWMRSWVGRTGETPSRVAFGAAFGVGAGRWGWSGDGKSRSCGPRFAPSMARVHVIAFALPLPRFAAQTAGPVSPTPTPRRFAAAPDSGAPYNRHAAAVAPTHGRRKPAEPHSPKSADHGSARPKAACSMATMDLSKVGRGGLAGALSAMDGAKRGPHGCGCCRPPQTHPAPPTSSPAGFCCCRCFGLKKRAAGLQARHPTTNQ